MKKWEGKQIDKITQELGDATAGYNMPREDRQQETIAQTPQFDTLRSAPPFQKR